MPIQLLKTTTRDITDRQTTVQPTKAMARGFTQTCTNMVYWCTFIIQQKEKIKKINSLQKVPIY